MPFQGKTYAKNRGAEVVFYMLTDNSFLRSIYQDPANKLQERFLTSQARQKHL
jgi:hypothetical protein